MSVAVTNSVYVNCVGRVDDGDGVIYTVCVETTVEKSVIVETGILFSDQSRGGENGQDTDVGNCEVDSDSPVVVVRLLDKLVVFVEF